MAVLRSDYEKAYTGPGEVAVLCEGDLLGYEATMLGRWFTERLGNDPVADLWPCGTNEALFGVSDAIGRARPVVVIEDRDYRTWGEAERECDQKKGERRAREVRLAEWRAWRFNEIENYLLQPGVVETAAVEVFSCSESDVSEALSRIIPTLAVHETCQYVLYQVRRLWAASDTSRHLPSNLGSRPRWDDTAGRLRAPGFCSVRDVLRGNLQGWKATHSWGCEGDSFGNIDVVKSLEGKYEEWRNMGHDNDEWRREWSGKEVLRWLRIWLAARFGWRSPATPGGEKVAWNTLRSQERDTKDREIERLLAVPLRQHFLRCLKDRGPSAVACEWTEMADAVRRAKSQAS